jgi:hypothetical protein
MRSPISWNFWGWSRQHKEGLEARFCKSSCPAQEPTPYPLVIFGYTIIFRLSWPFDDPATVTGSQEERLAAFRKVRDQILTVFRRVRDDQQES